MKELPSEHVAILGVTDPDAHSAAATSTGWIDAGGFHNFMAVLQTGIMEAGATLNAKLEQATNGSGGSAKDITGKAIVEIDEASASPPDTNDKQHVINLKQEELDVEGGFTHFRLTTTLVSTASPDLTSDFSAIVFGLNPRYLPATENDAATVGQIIN